MRQVIEISSMMIVVSPLFSESIGIIIVAVITTAFFTYLTHTRNGIRTNRNSKDRRNRD